MWPLRHNDLTVDNQVSYSIAVRARMNGHREFGTGT